MLQISSQRLSIDRRADDIAMQALLDAGATLVGTTQMDELAYSLEGQNVHYGTPRNPACPNRIPGGSSSGSAVSQGRPCAVPTSQTIMACQQLSSKRQGPA